MLRRVPSSVTTAAVRHVVRCVCSDCVGLVVESERNIGVVKVIRMSSACWCRCEGVESEVVRLLMGEERRVWCRSLEERAVAACRQAKKKVQAQV